MNPCRAEALTKQAFSCIPSDVERRRSLRAAAREARMPTEHRDYIMRLVEQLGAMLRELMGRLQPGRGAATGVVQEAQAAQAALLGPLATTASIVDAATAVRLVGNHELVALWIRFLRVEATARRLEGQEPQARTLEERARALEQAAGELET